MCAWDNSYRLSSLKVLDDFLCFDFLLEWYPIQWLNVYEVISINFDDYSFGTFKLIISDYYSITNL